MKFGGKADRIFVLLIAVTILSKIIVSRVETVPSDRAVVLPLAVALSASGLSVSRQADPPGGDVLSAFGKNCRMWVRDYAPYGTALSYYRSEAAAFGRLVFVYRGQVRGSPPKLGPLLRYYLGRELTRLGLKANRPPILAVAASPGCDLKSISWNRVAEVPW